nr:MAG TPA: tail protein [Caudoviricetes sp.]
MINVSNAFRERLEAGEPVRMVVDITFPDGTKKTINKDIMNGDNGFSDCADSSSFPVGVTVCKTLTLSINNDQEQWKNYNFYGAKIHAYLKLQTSYAAPESVSTLLDESYNPILDSTGDPIIATQAATKDIIETIDKGVYTVTTPEQYSDIINVTALDDMYKANKTYTSGLKLPQSLINLVRDACKTVGIGMNLTMDHGDIIIRSVPDSMTFRQLFGYAAMVESANARIDYSGNLQFVKWDFGKMESDNAATVDTDGFVHFGDANPSIDTDGFVSLPGWTINAEGFLALTSGPGSDVQRLMAYANPPALSSDDIVITGIKVMNGQSNDDANTDYSGMYGEEGYVLELENELIDTDQLQTVANIIGEQIVGARFRNLEGDLVYNPLVEFGDMVYTYDRLGNKYLTPLTDVSGNVGGLTTVKTQADDPIRGSSDFYGNSTKAIVAARQMVRKETSAREEAIRRLAETLNSSSGLYMTQEPQQDGSIIYYMHNKPTIAESNIIWKLTAEAFAVSIDGGKTYPYGFAVTGELITRLLYAEGINADYINAGTLVVRDKSGNAIFEADMDTGSVTLDGSCVTIGGKPLDEKIEDVENMAALARNMTMQLDNDYQGIPVDSDGNYTEFPECTTTATVMYGTQDITDNCTYTITTSQNIQGSWNRETKTYTVTGLTADSGWVNIKAAYLNNLVVSKQFSLAKQYAGPQGVPGVDGYDGKDGANGIPGKDGKDGKTQYTHLAYANSADGKTDFSVSDGNREYIGMYVDFVEADSTDPTKYTWSLIKGANGAQGVPGTPGVNGKTPYFHIAYANSADGRTGFSVDDSVNKLYIGQYTDYAPDDSTDPTKYSWTKIKGEQGTAGRTYFFQSNADVLLMGADKKITPSSLIVDSFYRDGNGEIAQSQKGWWKLEKSTDNGATWSALTVSQTAALDRLSINVNSLSLNAHDMLKVSLYFDQSKTKLADYQTFSVAVDVASLTQEQIVDILSDGGKFKGLYYGKDESGNTTLYISFNAAKGGTLALGGQNDGNGLMKIYDSSGSLILTVGQNGIETRATTLTDKNAKGKIAFNKKGLTFTEDIAGGGTGTGEDLHLEKSIISFDSLANIIGELDKLTVRKDAKIEGRLLFYDYENQSKKASEAVTRQPIASVTADGNRVAFLNSDYHANGYGAGTEHGSYRLGVKAQWGGRSYEMHYIYTNLNISDIRLKENIKNSETDALETVNRMKVRQFDWKERMGGWHQNIGFVADELEEIDPNLALGGGYDENGEMDIKQINSPYLLNYAIKAIQELSAKVDEQEKRIKELERRLQDGKI